MRKTMTHTTKTILRRVLTVAAISGAAVLGTTNANAGSIANSLHDLSAGTTGAASEICAFCHTPHGSDTAAAAPLWNKTLPASGSFTLYSTLGTSTLSGDEQPVGSVSLACLSCHDGTQAMDAVLNMPGRGANPGNIAAIGVMTGATNDLAVRGTDLTDDHPIGIAYGGMTANSEFSTVQSGSFNGYTQYWVDSPGESGEGGTATTREKQDMILYKRALADTVARVECASCHDPHNGGAGTSTFLRIQNDESKVCLTCHTK